MGCIKHSMMFEAQLTDIFQHVKKGTSKVKEEKEEGTSLDSECGGTVGLVL